MTIEVDHLVKRHLSRRNDVAAEKLVQSIYDLLAQLLELTQRRGSGRHLRLQRGLQLVQLEALLWTFLVRREGERRRGRCRRRRRRRGLGIGFVQAVDVNQPVHEAEQLGCQILDFRSVSVQAAQFFEQGSHFRREVVFAQHAQELNHVSVSGAVTRGSLQMRLVEGVQALTERAFG